MVMQFGQFLDHDITLTPEEEVTGCCAEEAARGVPGCFPILIPKSDPTFANLVYVLVHVNSVKLKLSFSPLR